MRTVSIDCADAETALNKIAATTTVRNIIDFVLSSSRTTIDVRLKLLIGKTAFPER